VLQAVIFDADGVLINASEIHFQAFNRALATKGWMITQSEHRTTFNGLPTVKKLEYLTEHRGLPIELHKEILDTKQKLTEEVINDFIQPDPEKIELFDALCSAGFAVAVASNMQQGNLEALLKRLGLQGHLDVVIGHDRVGYQRVKPCPDIYLYSATAMACSMDCTAIVVDGNESLAAAKAADPLDIITVRDHEEVNLELLSRILRFFPEQLHAA
jgi:beta-phosphoglucomutase